MRGCGIGVSNIIFQGDFLKTVKNLPEKRKQSTKPPTSLEKEKPSTQQKFSTFSFRHAIIKPSRGTLAKADGHRTRRSHSAANLAAHKRGTIGLLIDNPSRRRRNRPLREDFVPPKRWLKSPRARRTPMEGCGG